MTLLPPRWRSRRDTLERQGGRPARRSDRAISPQVLQLECRILMFKPPTGIVLEPAPPPPSPGQNGPPQLHPIPPPTPGELNLPLVPVPTPGGPTGTPIKSASLPPAHPTGVDDGSSMPPPPPSPGQNGPPQLHPIPPPTPGELNLPLVPIPTLGGPTGTATEPDPPPPSPGQNGPPQLHPIPPPTPGVLNLPLVPVPALAGRQAPPPNRTHRPPLLDRAFHHTRSSLWPCRSSTSSPTRLPRRARAPPGCFRPS